MIGGHGSGVRPAVRRHRGGRVGPRGFSKASTFVLDPGAVGAFVAVTASQIRMALGIAPIAFITATMLDTKDRHDRTEPE